MSKLEKLCIYAFTVLVIVIFFNLGFMVFMAIFYPHSWSVLLALKVEVAAILIVIVTFGIVSFFQDAFFY